MHPAFMKYVIQETTYQQLYAIMNVELILPTFNINGKF